MRQDQISLQLYTLREETARDMPGTLRKVSEIGYPAVEFAGYGDLAPQDLKTILDDLGLRASGVHVPPDSFETNLEAVLADMHTLNCAHAVVPSAPPGLRKDEASVARLAEDLNRWGELCRSEGVTLSYHNPDFEFAPMAGSTMWDVLVRKTDPGWSIWSWILLSQVRRRRPWGPSCGTSPTASPWSTSRIWPPTIRLRSAGRRRHATRSSLLEAADAAGAQWYIAEQDNRETHSKTENSLQYLHQLAKQERS